MGGGGVLTMHSTGLRLHFDLSLTCIGKCTLILVLSHLHVLTWRPEDVIGVHWKLPERGENAWCYLRTGFTVNHRVVSGDLNTSALRHLTSLARFYSVYPVLTTSWTRSYRDYRQVHATFLEFEPRLQRPHYVCTPFLAFLPLSKCDQARSDEALSQHVTFRSK